MIVRNDLRKSGVIPQALADCLLRIGGENPYGEPMFRLVLAEDRVTKANGIWNVWPENATLDDRSGLGINEAQKILLEGQRVIEGMQARGAPDEDIKKVGALIDEQINEMFKEHAEKHPLKTITGLNDDVPVYQMEGFIVEKWKPAHRWGTPDQWTAVTFQGEPVLGPYPQHGDYELVAGPTPYMPSTGDLERAVREHFKTMSDKPGTPAARLKQLLDKLEARRQDKLRRLKNLAEDFVKDGPLGKSRNTLSLGAGRIRQELATKAGLKGHYGN